MRNRTIKNPLTRRISRELVGDWKKYFVVSLFLILTIGFVSGMYVANGSMEISADRGRTEYQLENGHFELEKAAEEELIASIESGETVAGVYENFFRNETEDIDGDGVSDGTVRVYVRSDDVNLACLLDGRFPDRKSVV